MNTELARQVFEIVEAKVRSRPSPMEFEMAYQMRVAIDRIRFAINQAEQPHLKPEQTREITLQLADALDRLESAERDFQAKFHGVCDGRPEIGSPGRNGNQTDSVKPRTLCCP
jgi:hypothetical protein